MINIIINILLTSKVTIMSIFDYYKSLPGYKGKQEFRKKVMDKCDISYPTFQLKVHNDSWNKLEREAIEQIIQKDNADKN